MTRDLRFQGANRIHDKGVVELALRGSDRGSAGAALGFGRRAQSSAVPTSEDDGRGSGGRRGWGGRDSSVPRRWNAGSRRGRRRQFGKLLPGRSDRLGDGIRILDTELPLSIRSLEVENRASDARPPDSDVAQEGQ